MIYDRLAIITMSFSCIMLMVYLPKLYILVDRIRQCSRFSVPIDDWAPQSLDHLRFLSIHMVSRTKAKNWTLANT